ncbi:MAG: glycoside hydrolase family 3 C-terminal domain-containing protein [Fusicatenibacter sp.]|nr:glycoside hydrolase family 3 C-terminal domain-containing protein [Fusicatenibacter sp.]
MLGQTYRKQLLEQMTLREKAAELSQLWGENPDGTLMGLRHGFQKSTHLMDHAGSFLGFNGAELVLEAQRLHMEANTHHIPLLFMTDVIHGYKTIFPSVLGIGTTWDPALAEEMASVAAAEAAVSGVHVTFSPMADLVRDARWGRVTESTGEDPYLNSLFTAAFTRGYQGDGIDKPLHIASCVKHFAGYGAAEGGRDYDSTQIGDYSLYNDYLPAFSSAIDAGCELLMPGFNALNGMPCTCNRTLLQDILRDDLQFKGIVISDCTAIWELVPHGVCADNAEAAKRSFEAGIDIEMVSSTFYENLEKLVESGDISIEQIDAAVERILLLKDKMGLFENPYKDADPEKEKELHLCAAHRALARKAVAESAVLLKNDHQVLPLQEGEKIALIGPLSDSRELIDVWGLVNGEEKDCVTIREGLADQDILCVPGCHQWNLREIDAVHPSDDALMAEALQAAASCDKIVLALGEHPAMSSEAGSRSDLSLPANQLELLRALSCTGKPIITILISGRPLLVKEIADLSDAVLMAWFPGTEGGNGIADLLTGRCSPSGRLTMSFPRTTGQVPIYYNHLPTGRPNDTDKYESFKNGYIDIYPGPLYPFGYGLTYTEFDYSPVRLSTDQVICQDDTSAEPLLEASVTVTNTGTHEGTETVQLYLQDVAGTYSRPVRMLKGFRKVMLAPGENTVVTFPITADLLKYYIPGRGLTLEAGLFRVFIGSDAETSNKNEFTLTI